MITCSHCGTTSVLRDEAFEIAGEGGVMQDAPSLITLGRHVVIAGRARYLPVGHARFSYGQGAGGTNTGASTDRWRWVLAGSAPTKETTPSSRLLDRNRLAPKGFKPSLGAVTQIMGRPPITVTEAETAHCVAVRGEFPEELEIGEAHLYFDLSGPGRPGWRLTRNGTAAKAWSIGRWIDPWDVTSGMSDTADQTLQMNCTQCGCGA